MSFELSAGFKASDQQEQGQDNGSGHFNCGS